MRSITLARRYCSYLQRTETTWTPVALSLISTTASRVQHFYRQSNSDLGMHETSMTRLYRFGQTIVRTDWRSQGTQWLSKCVRNNESLSQYKWFLCMQVTRKQVESYEPGRQIPSIQLLVVPTEIYSVHVARAASTRLFHVNFLGAQPFCTLQLVLSPIPFKGMWI